MSSAAACASNHVLEGIGSVHKEELEYLPMELLTEILKNLEWRDVLHVRETSRRLYDASKALNLWLYMFRQYTSTSLIPPRLEAPIGNYSQEDLEDWLLRRIGADIVWNQDGERPFLHRIINDSESENLHLLEGGRWLIGVSHQGAVMCHDLDAPGDVKSEVLIDMEQIVPRALPGSGCSAKSAIDMLPESTTLSFNLVVVHSQVGSADRRHHPSLITTSIFNVSLIGNGRGAKLEATALLSHSYDNPTQFPQRIDLCGTYLAIFTHTLRNYHFYLDIIDWKKMKGTDYPRQTYYTPPEGDVRLLPDGRVVCFFESFATIDSIDDRNIVTSAGDKSPWSPMWKLDIAHARLAFLHVSECLFDPTSGSYSFIFSTETHIQRLIIPSVHTVSPSCGPVIPYPDYGFNPNVLALGKHRGFNFSPRPPIHLLTYGSNVPTHCPSDGASEAHDCYITNVGYPGNRKGGYSRHPNLDEATGRVVIKKDSPLRTPGGALTLELVRNISVFDFGIYQPRY